MEENSLKETQDTKADRVCKKFLKEHEHDSNYQKEALIISLSKLQVEEMELWEKEHRKHCEKIKAHKRYMKSHDFGPCGGWCEFSIDITPTSFTDLASIRCECGKEHYLGEVCMQYKRYEDK